MGCNRDRPFARIEANAEHEAESWPRSVKVAVCHLGCRAPRFALR